MVTLLMALMGGYSSEGSPGIAFAGEAYVPVTSDVGYQYIGSYDVTRLNTIGTTELNDFKTTKTDITLPPAKNGVQLYRVRYRTVIPERGNRPVVVGGLIAVPDTPVGSYPVVSYQHGTVFSKTEVPSFPEQSPETRFMIARFAGNGYILVAADYIGKGTSTEPDSYLVRESAAQASTDMLFAAQAVLARLNITPGDLFLSGWSQGAYSTMVLRNRLEQVGTTVKAAATASTPMDLYVLITRWINNRTALDSDWLVGCVALLINSYEQYYSLPGLSVAAIKPQYRQTARDFYDNKIGWAEASKVFPKSTKEFLQTDFADASSLAANRFFQKLQDNQAYQWRFRTPSRYYYGKIDEVVPPYIATLPVAYQEAIAGATATAVYAGDNADHRGTFIFGMLDQKQWFDGLLKN
jgi:pimeloyl-ACP methyl ester carboxylesterase